MNKCPNIHCGRAGDDIGQCGSFATCPRQAVPVEVTDVVLHCGLCELTRVVPAATIIQGKSISEAHMCLSGVCQARPVSTTAPAPLSVKGKATNGKGQQTEG
jgi:hypothetical protein